MVSMVVFSSRTIARRRWATTGNASNSGAELIICSGVVGSGALGATLNISESSRFLAVETRACHRQANTLRPHDGLGTPHEQHPTWAQCADKSLKNAFLRFFSEVDDDVAPGDQVERAVRIGIQQQIVFGEPNHGPRRRAYRHPTGLLGDEPALHTLGT